VLFVGDDDTDEEAFGHALAVPAVMVRVGPARRSRAPWRLDGQADVDRLLRWLAGSRPEAGPPGRSVERDEGGGREALPRVLAFLRALWELDHALGSRSKRMHADLGVTGPQRLVLRTLGLRPGASPAELARLLHLHPASVTRLVAGLVRRGLVSRSPDPGDGRRLRLAPTARGLRLGAARTGTVEAEVAQVLRRHGPDEVAGAQALLTELARALQPARRRR
jgi:DNA-binding MarR family transcriptional regulator